jgi:hypothetical protein
VVGVAPVATGADPAATVAASSAAIGATIPAAAAGAVTGVTPAVAAATAGSAAAAGVGGWTATCSAGVPAAAVLPGLHADTPQTPHSCVLATAAPAADVVLGLGDALIAAWAQAGTHPVRLALFSRDLQCVRQQIYSQACLLPAAGRCADDGRTRGLPQFRAQLQATWCRLLCQGWQYPPYKLLLLQANCMG